jgi:hypothetical protein
VESLALGLSCTLFDHNILVTRTYISLTFTPTRLNRTSRNQTYEELFRLG